MFHLLSLSFSDPCPQFGLSNILPARQGGNTQKSARNLVDRFPTNAYAINGPYHLHRLRRSLSLLLFLDSLQVSLLPIWL